MAPDGTVPRRTRRSASRGLRRPRTPTGSVPCSERSNVVVVRSTPRWFSFGGPLPPPRSLRAGPSRCRWPSRCWRGHPGAPRHRSQRPSLTAPGRSTSDSAISCARSRRCAPRRAVRSAAGPARGRRSRTSAATRLPPQHRPAGRPGGELQRRWPLVRSRAAPPIGMVSHTLGVLAQPPGGTRCRRSSARWGPRVCDGECSLRRRSPVRRARTLAPARRAWAARPRPAQTAGAR